MILWGIRWMEGFEFSMVIFSVESWVFVLRFINDVFVGDFV